MGCQRPTAFLSMQEVKSWPIIGWMAYLGGTVFVNRDSKRAALNAMSEIEMKVDWGITVIIFPEGGTSDGREVRTFKSTFFKIPAGRNIPVRPASIRYAEDIVDAVAWHSGAHILAHFWNLAGLKKIRASVFYGAPILPLAEWGSAVEVRKQLCARAYESVAAGFESKKQH
jgi:1-acyl-sn-glycerol-3-phosphate acyltransferase